MQKIKFRTVLCLPFWFCLLMFATTPLVAQTVNGDDDAAWKPLLTEDLKNWDVFIGVPHTSVELDGYEKSKDVTKGTPVGLGKDPKNVFSVSMVDGQPVLHITGEIYGGLSTKEEFENYHLHLEIKWGEKKWEPRLYSSRDSGILYHCVGKHGAFWHAWMQSVEFQVEEKHIGDFMGLAGTRAATTAVALIDQNTGKPRNATNVFSPTGELTELGNGRPIFRTRAMADAEKPHGQWNSLDLYTRGDQSIHVVNGKPVLMGTHISFRGDDGFEELTRGKIQLQSSASELFYRNVKIRPINQFPADLLKSLTPPGK